MSSRALGLGGGAAPQQQQGETGYQPPLHGNNPHGQGTAITGDFLPSSELPYSGDPTGGEGCPDPTDCEEVVIGRSRGEKNNPYHGHVTILSVLGNEFPPGGVDTGPGESESFSPLGVFFGPLCAGSGGAICLGALEANSETTQNSSKNSFEFVRLNSNSPFGQAGVSLFRSEGNIEEDQNCQRSEGSSSAARVSASQNEDVSNGAEPRQNGGFELRVLSSSAESQACNNSAPTQTNESSVFNSASTERRFTFSSARMRRCSTSSSSRSSATPMTRTATARHVHQAPVPYGVREAFNVFILPFFLPDPVAASQRGINGEDGPLALIKATVAASESHAVAPPAPTTPSTPGSGTVAGAVGGQPGAGPSGQEAPGGPVSREARPGDEDLAFTGSDVLILGLIGIGLVMAGLATTRRAVRHRRATV